MSHTRRDWLTPAAERPWHSCEVDSGHDQHRSAVRLDWGGQGAAAICPGAGFAVVVDVLSFGTAVSVAADRGAEIFPCRWRDRSAAEFARRHDAVLAAGRSQLAPAAAASGATRQPAVSLSPASIRAASTLRRLVLPSPNGSALAAQLGDGDIVVVAACFRNRWAVARWLVSQAGSAVRPGPAIAVVAAGERRADGSLRPAVEDLWGAGAVISALGALGLEHASPEAQAAAAAFDAVRPELAAQPGQAVAGGNSRAPASARTWRSPPNSTPAGPFRCWPATGSSTPPGLPLRGRYTALANPGPRLDRHRETGGTVRPAGP